MADQTSRLTPTYPAPLCRVPNPLSPLTAPVLTAPVLTNPGPDRPRPPRPVAPTARQLTRSHPIADPSASPPNDLKLVFAYYRII
jgi:hypothetical protein